METKDTKITPQGHAAIYHRPKAAAQALELDHRDDLEALAKRYGYTRTTVFAERHIPGNTRLQCRDAFTALKRAIEGNEQPAQDAEEASASPTPITAIVVASENRLFRGPMLEDLALFVNLCADHGVVVITPTRTYDFRTHTDVVQFCFTCMSASDAIERMMLSGMQEGRRRAAARRNTHSVD